MQVVPYRAGAHAGTIGAFVILDFLRPPTRPWCTWSAGRGHLPQGRSDVNRYTLAFDRLLAAALHPDDSAPLIERLARTLR